MSFGLNFYTQLHLMDFFLLERKNSLYISCLQRAVKYWNLTFLEQWCHHLYPEYSRFLCSHLNHIANHCAFSGRFILVYHYLLWFLQFHHPQSRLQNVCQVYLLTSILLTSFSYRPELKIPGLVPHKNDARFYIITSIIVMFCPVSSEGGRLTSSETCFSDCSEFISRHAN